MIGNVWEWTDGWYDPGQALEGGCAGGPGSNSLNFARVGGRYGLRLTPGYRLDLIGFRCCRSAPGFFGGQVARKGALGPCPGRGRVSRSRVASAPGKRRCIRGTPSWNLTPQVRLSVDRLPAPGSGGWRCSWSRRGRGLTAPSPATSTDPRAGPPACPQGPRHPLPPRAGPRLHRRRSSGISACRVATTGIPAACASSRITGAPPSPSPVRRGPARLEQDVTAAQLFEDSGVRENPKSLRVFPDSRLRKSPPPPRARSGPSPISTSRRSAPVRSRARATALIPSGIPFFSRKEAQIRIRVCSPAAGRSKGMRARFHPLDGGRRSFLPGTRCGPAAPPWSSPPPETARPR